MASYKITAVPSDEKEVRHVSFKDARKFFAVDASGSTGGAPMRSEQAFVGAIHEKSSAPHHDSVCRWGSHCQDSTVDWPSLQWRSDQGGTRPTSILHNESALGSIWSSDLWFLLTDGQVGDDEVVGFATLATEKAIFGCPTVFMITSRLSQFPREANVSVGITSYANAVDALCLFKDYITGRIYIIAAKGCFDGLNQAKSGDTWEDLTSFETEATLCAKIDKLDIKVQTAESRDDLPTGVTLGADWEAAHDVLTRVDLVLLLRADVLNDDELALLLNDEALDVLTLAYKTRGMLTGFRAWLLAQKIEQITTKLEDIAGATVIIAELGKPDLSLEQRSGLQAKLRLAHTSNRAHYLATLDEDRSAPARLRNRMVDRALQQLAAIEKAGYSADILDRRSNRARRAGDVFTDSAVAESTLDFNAPAYKSACLVCCGEDEIMSVALRVLDPEAAAANTTDFALDFPLAAGRFPANMNVLSSQCICFQCAICGNPGRSIYNEDIAAIFPILEYSGANKMYINQQLYKGLTGGLKIGIPIVGQLFATIINRKLETKEWAGATGSLDVETQCRKGALEFMLTSVLENLRCRETFNELGAWVKYPQALEWAAKDFAAQGLQSWIVGYPVAGFYQVIRFGQMMEVFSREQIQDMKALKLVQSVTSAYLANVLAKKPRAWCQQLLCLIYVDFNAELVPRDLGPDNTILVDIDNFWRRLADWLSADAELFLDWMPDRKAAIMPKLQVLIFWLVHFQLAHTTAKTYFTVIRNKEPLAAAVLSTTEELPESLTMEILLSPFRNKAAFLNAQIAAKHHTGIIPFKNPFGASVLRCGHPDCNASFLPSDVQLDEATVLTPAILDQIRIGRGDHLIEAFGVSESFLTNGTGLPEPTALPLPPTSSHTTLHLSIARTWANLDLKTRRAVANGEAKAVKDFVEATLKAICTTGRGDVCAGGLAASVKALLPSFLQAVGHALALCGEDGQEVANYEHDFAENKMELKVIYELKLDRLLGGGTEMV